MEKLIISAIERLNQISVRGEDAEGIVYIKQSLMAMLNALREAKAERINKEKQQALHEEGGTNNADIR